MARECDCNKAFEEKIRMNSDRLVMSFVDADSKEKAANVLDQMVAYVHGVNDALHLAGADRDIFYEVRHEQIKMAEQFSQKWGE